MFSHFQMLIEKYPNSDIQDIDRRKWIISDQYTFANMMCVIRRRINLPPEKAIFMFIDGEMPPLR